MDILVELPLVLNEEFLDEIILLWISAHEVHDHILVIVLCDLVGYGICILDGEEFFGLGDILQDGCRWCVKSIHLLFFQDIEWEQG